MIADENHLSHLSARIEQHLKSFEAFEKVRWQALAFLSALAVAGLSVIVRLSSPYEARIGAMVLVVLVCLAGITIQIRVATVVAALWNRVRRLQTHIDEQFAINSDPKIRTALSLPALEIRSKPWKLGIAVHVSTCFVFSSMAGIAVSLLLWTMGASGHLATLLGGGFLIVLTAAFCYWSARISQALEHDDESTLAE